MYFIEGCGAPLGLFLLGGCYFASFCSRCPLYVIVIFAYNLRIQLLHNIEMMPK